MRSQEELNNYLRKKIKTGYPEGELRNELIQEGYSADQIKTAFQRLQSGSPQHSQPGRKGDLWYLLSITLGIVGLALASVEIFQHYHRFAYVLIIIGVAGIVIRYLVQQSKADRDDKAA